MGVKMKDGTEKTIKAGESYLIPPGHLPAMEEDAVMVEFSQVRKLAQNSGQLQPFIAVFPQNDRNAWANLHLLRQPNTCLTPGHDLHRGRQARRPGPGARAGVCRPDGPHDLPARPGLASQGP
jgi:hypothetical protein